LCIRVRTGLYSACPFILADSKYPVLCLLPLTGCEGPDTPRGEKTSRFILSVRKDMTKSRTAASVKLTVYSNLESSLENRGPQANANSKTEDPWMAILVKELEKSFRHFAKETGRLTRFVQPKKRCHIPSEGFNCLLTLRMDKVERAFRTYMRRKDELLNYIQATSWKAQRRNTGIPASALSCDWPPQQAAIDRTQEKPADSPQNQSQRYALRK
jgi:hypothetical protein